MALRELLKRSSFLVNAVRSARLWAGGGRTNYDIANELAAFCPYSSGSLQALAALALQSAQQTFPLICSLIGATSQSPIAPRPIEAIFPAQADSSDTRELAALFNRYGSDKSSAQNYHLLYAPLLASRRRDRLRLLEIGIGTNKTDVVSNMGASGKPGASLRAFRDFCPNANVFGADIDRRVLFEEDRIRTYYVDQTRYSSFDELYFNVADDMFDLVIDDGLHSPNANIATMLFALRILRPSGFFIVEDIPLSSMPVWQVVAAILPESYRPTIVQTKNALLFMIQKPN
jgi:SAM-dependent methyltransferase